MIVKLNNLVIDTDAITAIFTDEEKKIPTYHLRLGDREWLIDAGERDALVSFLEPLDIMGRNETKRPGYDTQTLNPETIVPDPETISGFRETKPARKRSR